jgi:hypothetical protein
MEHVIPIEESLSREVEIKEAGEPSRGHDQPSSATEELSITVQEKGSNSSVEEKFKKLREAADNLLKRGTPHPKIRKVVLVHFNQNKVIHLLKVLFLIWIVVSLQKFGFHSSNTISLWYINQ